MKVVKITAQSNKISLETAWKIITDIEKYPQIVKYVKTVKIYGTGEGSRWDDVTTILGIPLKLQHTVTTFKKNKEYSFTLSLAPKGYMRQTYIISKKNGGSLMEASITFTLGNKFLDNTIGILLQKRLKKMLIDTLKNFS